MINFLPKTGRALEGSEVASESGHFRNLKEDKKENNTMVELLKKFMKDEEGQDLVEYALLLVFLALAAIAVLPTLGSAVNNVFSRSASTLSAS
jgi:pilus assembly protein Flp/PilA